MIQEMVDKTADKIKMIEIKLSQRAKPGHGGLLPKLPRRSLQPEG